MASSLPFPPPAVARLAGSPPALRHTVAPGADRGGGRETVTGRLPDNPRRGVPAALPFAGTSLRLGRWGHGRGDGGGMLTRRRGRRRAGEAALAILRCTRSGPGDWAVGWAGGKSGYVKISKTTANNPAQRWPVLLTGGVHARELAPPDALVSFLGKLLAAYAASSAITYPAWTDPVGGI